MLPFYLDPVAGPQTQDEPSLGEVVYAGRCHGDGRGAPDEYADYAGSQLDPFGGQRAGGKGGELIAPVALGEPEGIVAQLIG